MTDDDHPERPEETADELDRQRSQELRRVIMRKSVRRDRARRRRNENIWSYLGTFGLVGWTVAVPTLLGLALGLFLDGRFEGERRFTVAFLVLGLSVGCAMAWYWVRRESEDR